MQQDALALNEKVKRAVFDFLLFCDDVSSTTMKQVRNHLENIVLIPKRYFDDNGIENMRNAIIKFETIRTAHRSIYTYSDYIQKKFGDKSADKVFRNRKFSSQENETLAQYIDEFISTSGINEEQLSADMRTENVDLELFWAGLQELFPEKSLRVLDIRVNNFILKKTGRSRALKEGEPERIRELVEIHGYQWVAIGKIMELSPAKIRAYYTQMVKYGCSDDAGPFTAEESARLVQVVKTLAGYRDAAEDELASVPTFQMQWSQVAELMGGRRRPTTYARKWDALARGGGGGDDQRVRDSNCSTILPRGQKKEHTQVLQLLHILDDMDLEDESSVNFHGIDMYMKLFNSSLKRWTAMSKLCPPHITVMRDKVKYLISRYDELVSTKYGSNWQLQLLDYLAEVDMDESVAVNWKEVDRVLKVTGSRQRWKLLARECPADDESLGSFDQQVLFLRNKYATLARKAISYKVTKRELTFRKYHFRSPYSSTGHSAIASSSSGSGGNTGHDAVSGDVDSNTNNNEEDEDNVSNLIASWKDAHPNWETDLLSKRTTGSSSNSKNSKPKSKHSDNVAIATATSRTQMVEEDASCDTSVTAVGRSERKKHHKRDSSVEEGGDNRKRRHHYRHSDGSKLSDEEVMEGDGESSFKKKKHKHKHRSDDGSGDDDR